MQQNTFYPIVLTILDGWGYSDKVQGNAIKLAKTPIIDKLWNTYSHTLLNASGKYVGLPENQMGNSEVGHTTIGSGRVINQDLVRINKSIKDKSFFHNSTLHKIYKQTIINCSKLHLIGLCSNGGVHSHIEHLIALIKISKQYKLNTCIHITTDGRDTQPYISHQFIQEIIDQIQDTSYINICTISGRYYSMDRDCRWSRTEKAYNVLVDDSIEQIIDPLELIKNNHRNSISDEFIMPQRIYKGKISNEDSIIFFNFRPDRIRQLLHCFTKDTFKGFPTKTINNLNIITFTKYDTSLSIPIVFSPQHNTNFLGEILSNHGLKQLRLAETEKYAHVTYFFNGGIEEPFPGEDRELISSPQVETYDLAPKMSADQLTESVIRAIQKNIYQFIVINYANPDMVGHTGNLQATIEAIAKVDECLDKLYREVQLVDGTLIITADHGNAEYMIDYDNKPCTSHSINRVPFIIANSQFYNKQNIQLIEQGCLADIAPTILNLLHINIPQEMNGTSLINKLNKL
ncbi:phosphoglycerate mutase (plastid) [Chondrus crispus]|uniref:2,3-bisphosphoglycerate-independent phosphoglycerate mutase n=1 Tax=Chondrus crispus TaxID=2769 RepID=M5DD48_CHOCR|nr:phosphoglycerate mutase [Chondrus crispus]CCP38225.1 phosphoglycerate mutase [Chondrus crispus]|eukprot:YP_007627478.1 phosphoglycerate mutase (plastid) [Chondrus crispus]